MQEAGFWDDVQKAQEGTDNDFGGVISKDGITNRDNSFWGI